MSEDTAITPKDSSSSNLSHTKEDQDQKSI